MTEEEALQNLENAIQTLSHTRGHHGLVTNWALAFETTTLEAGSIIDIAAEGHTLAIPTLYQIGHERFFNLIEGDPE